jgi:4-amino-4-deoxy-L-arabinose transferase-like glycosyltransferase
MRMSRRSRYLVSAAIGIAAAFAWFMAAPALAMLAPFAGIGIAAVAFFVLTGLVRHGRRERRRRKFE